MSTSILVILSRALFVAETDDVLEPNAGRTGTSAYLNRREDARKLYYCLHAHPVYLQYILQRGTLSFTGAIPDTSEYSQEPEDDR
jgi:hypothetical protein